MIPRRAPRPWLVKPAKGCRPWIIALLGIDRSNDKQRLIELLKSETPLPKQARLDLADLLERYKLTRLRGKQRTPSYDLSDTVAQLDAAKASARRSIKNGMKPEAAIELAARVNGVHKDMLRLHLAGRNAAARRAIKRLKDRISSP